MRDFAQHDVSVVCVCKSLLCVKIGLFCVCLQVSFVCVCRSLLCVPLLSGASMTFVLCVDMNLFCV